MRSEEPAAPRQLFPDANRYYERQSQRDPVHHHQQVVGESDFLDRAERFRHPIRKQRQRKIKRSPLAHED